MEPCESDQGDPDPDQKRHGVEEIGGLLVGDDSFEAQQQRQVQARHRAEGVQPQDRAIADAAGGSQSDETCSRRGG